MSPGGFGCAALLIGATTLFSRSGFAATLTTVYSGSGSLSSSYSMCTGIVSFISDGECDTSNNNALCGYDGGDCCECTCEDSFYSCSNNAFDTCIDPSAPTACNFSGSTSSYTTPGTGSGGYPSSNPSGCNVPWISDGYCDSVNNNEACVYDGGDCCECTCDDGEYECSSSSVDCIDPDANCQGTYDDDSTYGGGTVSGTNSTSWLTTFSGCVLTWISDGYCDAENNNEPCGYDGGDCCSCTCDDGSNYLCSSNGYDCVDPDAECTETSYTDDETGTATTPSPVGANCMPESVSDGYCDKDNNREECLYDGGDCCECTCVDGVKHNCAQDKFDCLDPDADCADDSDDGATSVGDDSSQTGSDQASEEDAKWADAAWEIAVTIVGTVCAAVILSASAWLCRRKLCQ